MKKTILIGWFCWSWAGCGADDGFLPEPEHHRPSLAQCPTERPSTDWAAQIASDMAMGWGPIECDLDEECTEEPDGRCSRLGDGWYRCTYHECVTDYDCNGKACACGTGPTGANQCKAGECILDADCGPGGWCSPSPVDECQPGFGDFGFFCHTGQDKCTDDEDCPPCPDTTKCQHTGYCAWDPEAGYWACSYQGCVT